MVKENFRLFQKFVYACQVLIIVIYCLACSYRGLYQLVEVLGRFGWVFSRAQSSLLERKYDDFEVVLRARRKPLGGGGAAWGVRVTLPKLVVLSWMHDALCSRKPKVNGQNRIQVGKVRVSTRKAIGNFIGGRTITCQASIAKKPEPAPGLKEWAGRSSVHTN